MTFVLAMTAAQAQTVDGYDAHGFTLAGNVGGPLDGQVTWRPSTQTSGTWSARAVLEYADAPFMLWYDVGLPTERQQAVVDDVVAVNASGRMWLSDGVSAAVAFPVFLSTKGADGTGSPGLGDVRLSLPVRAVQRPAEGGIGVDVVPFATLPTGDPRAFLGSSGLAGGLLMVAGWEQGRVAVDGNLGVENAPAIRYANLRGGARALGSASLSVGLSDEIGVRAEANLRAALARNDLAWSEAPGEALLSVGGLHGGGLTWNVGASQAFTPGVGAAAYRVFAGIGYTAGGSEGGPVRTPVAREEAVIEAPAEPDQDKDGVADLGDMCPSEAESANGYADLDGCPDVLGDVAVVVRDADGAAIANAKVTLAGAVQTSGADGVATFLGLMPGSSAAASVVGPAGFEAGSSGEGLVVEGYTERPVQLAYVPIHVTLTAVDVKGAPVDATVTLEGPAKVGPVALGPDGSEGVDLRPGTWTIAMGAAKTVTVSQNLVLAPGAPPPTVNTVLRKAK